jgi:hypothetical protein
MVRRCTQGFYALSMIIRRAMRKIQPHDIHTCRHQFSQPFRAARCRAEGRYDFCGALHGKGSDQLLLVGALLKNLNGRQFLALKKLQKCPASG